MPAGSALGVPQRSSGLSSRPLLCGPSFPLPHITQSWGHLRLFKKGTRSGRGWRARVWETDTRVHQEWWHSCPDTSPIQIGIQRPKALPCCGAGAKDTRATHWREDERCVGWTRPSFVGAWASKHACLVLTSQSQTDQFKFEIVFSPLASAKKKVGIKQPMLCSLRCLACAVQSAMLGRGGLRSPFLWLESAKLKDKYSYLVHT